MTAQIPRLRERSFLQPREIEAIDLLEQFHECLGAMVERGFALGGAGECRVADRAGGIEVLRHPGEASGPVGTEPFEFARHRDRRRRCVWGFSHAHGCGLRREHERGFDIAAVDAVLFLVGRERAVRIAEAVPANRDGEHAEPRTQVARHRFHGGDVAAMARHQHELAHAGARQAFAELGPGRHRGRGRQCERARKRQMLRRNADALHRQKRDGQVGGQKLLYARQIGFGDIGIDAERQVRAVLFDRGQRQHRDPARSRAGRPGNVLPGHLHPVAPGQRHPRHSLIVAVLSIFP